MPGRNCVCAIALNGAILEYFRGAYRCLISADEYLKNMVIIEIAVKEGRAEYSGRNSRILRNGAASICGRRVASMEAWGMAGMS
jgi:hypothetical protein